jgi:hypothetical protein
MPTKQIMLPTEQNVYQEKKLKLPGTKQPKEAGREETRFWLSAVSGQLSGN